MSDEELVIQRRESRLYALTDPDRSLWTVELLARADPAFLTVEDDVATIRLADETRRYRLSAPPPDYDSRFITATRIRDEEDA